MNACGMQFAYPVLNSEINSRRQPTHRATPSSQDTDGQFMWPGFGENSRVLKWICERVDGTGGRKRTPIGYVPTHRALDLTGLEISQDVIHPQTRACYPLTHISNTFNRTLATCTVQTR